MARVSLTAAPLTSGGVQPALVAANADGYKFHNNGAVFLMVENTNGASGGATVVIAAEIDRDGLALPDKEVSVAASETHLIGPFHPGIYNRTGSTDPNSVYVDFTGATADLEIQAFRLP